jgi:hypothetical protein
MFHLQTPVPIGLMGTLWPVLRLDKVCISVDRFFIAHSEAYSAGRLYCHDG